MANEAGLRGVVGVGVGAGEAQGRVPGVSSGHLFPTVSSGQASTYKVAGGWETERENVGAYILGAERLDLRLGGIASILGSLVGVAHVGELVADAVGDDVGVESLLLALVDERVDGLEGELGVLAAIEAGLELDGRHAQAEVEAGDGRLLHAGSVDTVVGRGVGGSSSTGAARRGIGRALVGARDVSAAVRSSGRGPVEVLDGEVGETCESGEH